MQAPIAPEVNELEEAARAVGVDLGAALRRASVAHSTYWRWREGRTEPNLGTIRRIKTAISELAVA